MKNIFNRLLFVAGTNREDYEGNKANYGENPIAVKRVDFIEIYKYSQ